MSKAGWGKIGLAVIFWGLNFSINRSLPYSLINTSLLLLGMQYFKSEGALMFIAGMGLMPLFLWVQASIFPGLMVVMTGIGLYLIDRSQHYKGIIWVGLVLTPFLLAVLGTNGMINDREKFFIFQSDAKSALTFTTHQYQTDLWTMGVPFRVSGIVHNFFISSLNQFGKNITSFVFLPNIYQTILLANLYLVILGIREKEDVWGMITISIILFTVIGLALHAGRDASLYPTIPFIFYLAGRGSSRAKRSVYLLLFFTQILILGWR